MKIVYLSNSAYPSRRAYMIQIVHMCNAFIKKGNNVLLFATDRSPQVSEDFYGEDVLFSVRKVHIPDIVGSLYYIPRFLWALAYTLQRYFFVRSCVREIKKRQYDIIYGRDEWLLWFASFSLPVSKMVFESHQAKMNFAVCRLVKKGVKCVVISEGIRDKYIEAGIPQDQILVAHDGVDETFFGEVESKEKARAQLGIKSDKSVAMYIGGLDTWKGVETFFKAAQEAKEVQFVVIGGNPEEVEKYRQQYPKVQFLGQRSYRELKDNQQAADVLVIPNTAKNELSAKYTSPLKLFAHLASGVPLVVSDIPSMRNVVSEKEVFFFDADDPEGLASVVSSVIQDTKLAEEKSRRAFELSKKYTWEERAKHILEFVGDK